MNQIEMYIDSIRVSLMTYEDVLMLKEKNGKRVLPLWIQKPLTEELHDFIGMLNADANIDFVGMEYSESGAIRVYLHMSEAGNSYQVDCPLSLALAVATLAGIQIFVSANAMQNAISIETCDIPGLIYTKNHDID